MPVIFPIGGGKGGVGKSFISANLGALMAKRGHRVILIDLDLGGSNLHTLLGIKSPQSGLDRFLDKTENRLEQVAVPTHISNLSFISSLHCSMEIANLYHAQKVKLINSILRLPCDCIILDLGAGTHFHTLDFFLTSDGGLFVCTPEPTAIENAFR
ncbi:MAG: P-loop NTPase, partial [Desulfobacterales bacterium]|nr:P-loop NTPase [Desulfobacterales bacterium]